MSGDVKSQAFKLPALLLSRLFVTSFSTLPCSLSRPKPGWLRGSVLNLQSQPTLPLRTLVTSRLHLPTCSVTLLCYPQSVCLCLWQCSGSPVHLEHPSSTQVLKEIINENMLELIENQRMNIKYVNLLKALKTLCHILWISIDIIIFAHYL